MDAGQHVCKVEGVQNCPACVDWRVDLWNGIHRYVASCGGDAGTDKFVYGNNARMQAVVDVEQCVTDQIGKAVDRALATYTVARKRNEHVKFKIVTVVCGGRRTYQSDLLDLLEQGAMIVSATALPIVDRYDDRRVAYVLQMPKPNTDPYR